MGSDIRHAFRSLRQTRGWSAVVIVSLALGIGANTALFGAVNALLVRAIPVSEPETLVRLGWAGESDMTTLQYGYGYWRPGPDGLPVSESFSHPVFQELVAANRTLQGLLACAPLWPNLNVVAEGRAEHASGLLVSGNFFALLGVPAGLGRVIGPEDDRPEAAPVAVISDRYWKQRFAGDPSVLGRVVRANDTPVTIVGVLRPGYRGIQSALATPPDVHLPLAFESRAGERSRLRSAPVWWLQVMGRLRPGATPAQVQGNLGGTFEAAARSGTTSYLESLSPEERETAGNAHRTRVPRLVVEPGGRGLYDPDPDTLQRTGLLAGVVALLMAIVCANVANLLLARTTERRREIGIRQAVGATRRRILRLLLVEGLVLSGLGGGAGLLVALGARRILPYETPPPLDWRVLGFAAALSLGAGLAASLLPALRATGIDPHGALAAGGRSVARSRPLASRALLVGQVAISLVLLVGAGLLLRTLENLRSVELGFDPERILLFDLDPFLIGYDEARAAALYDRVVAEVKALPGVRDASYSTSAFLSGSVWGGEVYPEGGDAPKGLSSRMLTVSPGFFRTMRVPVLGGRSFDDRDAEQAPHVAVISRAAAREWFEGESPLGRRLGLAPETRTEVEIVGIVGDVKYDDVRVAAPAVLYQAHAQAPSGGRTFEVRTAGPPAAIAETVREVVRRLDPALPLTNVATQAQQIERRFFQEQLLARAYALFGGLALSLAAIGLFGLASYDVAQRVREIGVRMALGAEARDVTRLIVLQSLALILTGVGLGLGLVLLAGRLLGSLLFGLGATDPATIAQAVAVLVGVGTVALLVPARRAARLDPVVALRAE